MHPQYAVVKGPYGGEEYVTIRRAKAGWAMHAPGWRAMHFTTPEAAFAKVQQHHAFVRMGHTE
jgi:hypothetical protein